jgi:hypothetical protein
MPDDQELLTNADRQIAEYQRHVTDQEEKLAALKAKGSVPEDARDLLTQFKENLRIAEEQREFLRRKALGETRAGPPQVGKP